MWLRFHRHSSGRHSHNHSMLLKWSEIHNWFYWSYLHLLMMKIKRSGAFPSTKQSLGQHNDPSNFNTEERCSHPTFIAVTWINTVLLKCIFLVTIVWLERTMSANIPLWNVYLFGIPWTSMAEINFHTSVKIHERTSQFSWSFAGQINF